MDNQNLAEDSIDDQQWHHLSPVSVIFFIGKTIGHFLKDAAAGLAPLAVIIFNSEEKGTMSLLLGGGLLALLLIVSLLQFWFFKFKTHQDKILINEGVFKKQHRTINFDRVQNINIVEPFYFKWFSLVTLQVETAGSGGNEANLAGIPITLAEELKALALETKKVNVDKVIQSDAAEANQKSLLLATATTSDLVKYGLTNNGMIWFFVFIAPFTGAIDDLLEKGIGQENLDWAINALGGGTQGGVILIVITIFLALGLAILFSILGSIFRFHNYRLSESNKTIKRKGGLLSTHEESTKRRKIQAIQRKTNFIGRWLKVENMVLKQASGQVNQKNTSRNLFVIPTRTKDESAELANIIFQEKRSYGEEKGIHSRYQVKTLLVSLIPIVILSLIIGSQLTWYALLMIPVAALLFYPLIRQRWKMYRYKISHKYGYFQSGFIGFRKTEFPLFKAQRVTINQSPLQRKRDLATLVIYFASQKITIPYMPMKDAQYWFNLISFQIETTHQNWF
ncbi:PH domain-containing protein [Aliikangiella marina]|uniref:PH domain-containing protein n=1 Tax=Aliikangiella marina TaxID=1712262 RepID=A0A545TIV5_9GAMM|nr:PH domain-containing protein [Aliikangiella marina]TQV77111.1 PH domain-containing protein [Aliikangiella marina]